MIADADRPVLLSCNPDNIPEELRKAKRWAPWAAPWDAEKQKYGKVPHRADRPESGLSNGSASGWVSFERALKAFKDNPHLFAGIGYLMTGAHGIVGVDLDHCVKDGVTAPWAAEIIAKLDSYTEYSPSGTGLHVILSGDLETDWSAKLGDGPHTSKSPGVDVYGGGARFLTFTGAHYPGSPKTVRAPRAGTLDGLAARYRKSKNLAKLHVLPLPSTLGVELPEISDLGLSSKIANFIEDGPDENADRSGLLIATAASLAGAGLTPEQAFAFMAGNDHVMEVALNKRGYDDNKAREYLWTHHCRRGAAIVEERRAVTLASFEPDHSDDDFSDLITPQKTNSNPADDFDDTSQEPVANRDLGPIKSARFEFQNIGAFMQRPAMSWIIKGFLPKASLCVLFGASSSGKSFLALDQAMAIARGVDWRGARTKQGAVAYVVAEGASGFGDRISAYCIANNITPERLPVHVLAAAPNMMLNADVKELGEQLKKLGSLSLIYMDTYARVMGDGNENEAKDTNKVIANCELLHRLTGALIVLVHHSGKDETKGARGSGALRAAADVELEIIRTNKYRALRVSKMKEGEDGSEHQFKLVNVVTGLDEDGEERTSCAVEHIAKQETPEVQPVKQHGPVQTRILDLLGTYLGGQVEREMFLNDLRDITPRNANGSEDTNWKMKSTRSLDTLIREGYVVDADGWLSLQNTACE
jgi:hypothetical protein